MLIKKQLLFAYSRSQGLNQEQHCSEVHFAELVVVVNVYFEFEPPLCYASILL